MLLGTHQGPLSLMTDEKAKVPEDRNFVPAEGACRHRGLYLHGVDLWGGVLS